MQDAVDAATADTASEEDGSVTADAQDSEGNDALAETLDDGPAETDVPPTCSDGKYNENETDKDCGGPDCLPCPVGKKCVLTRDCERGECINKRCRVSE